MIKAEELTKQRGGRAVVSDVTFRCEAGTNGRAPPGRGLLPDASSSAAGPSAREIPTRPA